MSIIVSSDTIGHQRTVMVKSSHTLTALETVFTPNRTDKMTNFAVIMRPRVDILAIDFDDAIVIRNGIHHLEGLVADIKWKVLHHLNISLLWFMVSIKALHSAFIIFLMVIR